MSSNDAPKRATAAQIANRKLGLYILPAACADIKLLVLDICQRTALSPAVSKLKSKLKFNISPFPSSFTSRLNIFVILRTSKIKAARERRTRVGSPSLPQPAANPFSSVGTDTASASAFTAPSNGFTFGQSQGFSRPATATGTSNNIPSASSSFDNNQSNAPGTFKLFGSQTTSAPPSFDFSSNNAQQVSNPFSNMSSNQNTGFQGFKGSMFNIPGASQPENKKPENQQNGSGGFFGQAPAQTSAPLFGATPTTSASLFSSSAGPNMFGQSNNNNPPTNIFGSATMPSPTKSTGGEAMQMSPDGPKSTAGQAMFNVSAPAPPIFKPTFSTPSTGPIFNMGGATATTSAATPAFSFKPTASASAPPASSGGSILFGASKPEESKAAPAVSSGNFMFGASASTPASTPLFGQQKPAEAPQATTTTAAPATTTSTTKPSSIFGANTSFSTAPSGGSLFSHLAQPNNAAASASAANGTSSIFSNLGQPKPDATPSPTKETNSLFGHLAQPKTDAAPAPAKETGSIFGHLAQPKAETVTSPAKESPPLFSAPSTSKPLFGAPSTATAQPPTQPAFSFFGQTTKPAESPKPATATTGGQTPSIFLTPSSNSIFQAQQQPTATQTENKTPTQSPMFAASTNIPPVTQPKPMFTSSVNAGTSGAAKPFSPTFGASPVPAPAAPVEAPAPPKPKYVDASTETVFEASVTMVNFRPTEAEYPPNATPEVREQFLRLWRLSALNASFQEEIASVNCWSQDLDPIIGRYVMLRKLIGHPHPIVTQYIPTTPGSKLPCKPLPPFSDYDAEYERERAQAGAKNSVSNGDAAPPGPSGVSHKRKASDAAEEESISSDKTGKRAKFDADKAKHSGDEADEAGEATPSKTLSLFANSFVAQKSRGSAADGDDEADVESDAESDADGASSEESGESNEEEESTDTDKQEEKTTTPSVSPPSTSNGGGRSLFDRIQRDENGQPIRQVQADELNEEAKSLANEANELASSVLGGSRTGSPFNAGSLTPLTGSTNGLDSTRSPSPTDPPKAKTSTPSIFANLAPSGSSNIFGASNSFTSTSSAGGSKPTTTSNIFGAPPSSATSSATSGSAPATSIFAAPSPISTPPPSNIFGAPPSTSAPAQTSVFATPSSAPTPTSNSSLAPPTTNIFGHLKPGNSSAQPGLSPFPLSAATSVDPSPAQSDTDATNDPSDEVEKHTQVDFTRSGPGEEDEDAVFECRSRAYQHINGQWEVKGLGVLRILKHRTNKKSRILLRADPSGSVLLNTNLMPEIEYQQNGTGVQFIVPSESGFQHWLLRVKTSEGACELKNSMEQHKKRD